MMTKIMQNIVNQVAATLQPGSTYITIVRDPIDLFESLWSYASMHYLFVTDYFFKTNHYRYQLTISII